MSSNGDFPSFHSKCLSSMSPKPTIKKKKLIESIYKGKKYWEEEKASPLLKGNTRAVARKRAANKSNES